MKRIVPILVVAALAVAGFYWRAPLMAALGFGDEDGRYLGYVEGETSLIAPPIAGRLVERAVDRGSQVKKGDRLFVIDPVMAKAEDKASQVDRAVLDLAEAAVLKGREGSRFDAVVTDVDERGARIQLVDLAVVSRVHAEGALPGDRITVQLVSADPALRQVKFQHDA